MLYGGTLGFAIITVSFFDISMLLYGKTMKMVGSGQILDISKNNYLP